MEKALPSDYEVKKISLSSLGVGGFAWKREDILQFLRDEKIAGFAVLGGDVLSESDGKLAYTYDNWSAPVRPRTESFDLFCNRCREAALKYIEHYPQNRSVVFAPVITSEVTAGWES